MARWLPLCLFLALALVPGTASAHKPSDSYLSLNVALERIEGRWDIALRDLEFAIGLDGDGDGSITWNELQARHDAIAGYALTRLRIRADTADCVLQPGEQLVENHSDGAYTVLRFGVDCAGSPGMTGAPRALDVGYSLFFDLDPQHRGLLSLQAGAAVQTAVFSPQNSRQAFDLDARGWLETVLTYLQEGAWHIWIGYDHILFLLALLFPAALRRADGAWHAVEDFRSAILDVAKIVTAFTLAHSITLSLAALEWVNLPSRFVESAIAISVIAAALNNLWPLVTRRLWLVAFLFGLIHGFGFASVLAGLGLPSGALLAALGGFNLGVELGQLAIVAVFFPLVFCLRRQALYARALLPASSAAVAGLAGLWLMERLFNLDLPLV